MTATPRKTHTAGSATVLLMVSSLLSGLLALVRIRYVNGLFGAGPAQDAYRAAFTLPDLLNYFLIGGAASISLITILNRYREAGDDAGGDRALSVILTTMLVVLGTGVVVMELLAPAGIWLMNDGFRKDPTTFALCVSLTRILLPAQLFFFIGSVMSSRLQVRKIFVYQACTPLIYNGGIILGAVLLHKQIGVYSLAVGVLAGVIVGSAMLNSLGAFRTGFRYFPRIGFRDPVFREWFLLALPLMIGVSLVMFDGVLLKKFASLQHGGITLIGNAKDLFNAPFNVIGSAAGAASLPFFTSLFQQRREFDYSTYVGRSISRLFAVGLLVSAWMIALAPWLLDLFKGGKFNHADVLTVTTLFQILAITLPIWAVQGIYARAFYAASDTRTPAITGTIVTVLSIPTYYLLFRASGLTGLAIASDIGIVLQTATLAVLLHRKRLVSLLHLDYPELGRALLAAIFAFLAAYVLVRELPPTATRKGDLVTLAAGTASWGLAALVTLLVTRSKLPRQLLHRKNT